ncbi:MAG: zf-HC2 domain-containing protein [Armatimonadetes bacterium]|nr:zf-HC2 domain-containing protein [Armatimonadota bacterium]
MRTHPSEEAISAWLDGEAAPDEAEFLRRHLADCESCQEQMDALAGVRVALSSFRNVTAPASFQGRLRAEWEGRWGRLNSRRPVGSFVLPWVPAVAAAMTLGALTPQFRHMWSHAPVAPSPVEESPRVARSTLPGTLPQGSLKEGTRKTNSIMTGKEAGKSPRKSPSPVKREAQRDAPSAPKNNVKRAAPRPNRVLLASASSSPITPSSSPRISVRQKERSGSQEDGIHRRRRPDHEPQRDRTISAQGAASTPERKLEMVTRQRTLTEAVQVARAVPVLEILVEKTPEDASLRQPLQTSCTWEAQNVETGVIRSGSVTRNYNTVGQLESVEVQLAATDLMNPERRNPSTPDTKPSIEESHESESPDHSSLGLRSLYAGILRDGANRLPAI